MSSNDTVTPVNFKLGVAILTPPHLITHTMEVSERYGKDGPGLKYLVVGDTVRRSKDRRQTTTGSIFQRTSKIIKEVFLPQGYPESVSDDYLEYQIWDTVQAFCSYITGTLATHAMLKGVGVGDSSASPVAATLTWILKDGLGMVGRIVFAWLRGTDLDCNAKKWRLVADVLNDIALCLELLAPLFPSIFLLIACMASITKAIVGVAGGATRAALVQHQARRDNMADVSAKDGSQETLVNLAGLIIGLILTPLVASHTGLVWLLFLVFTLLHLFANYQAISVVSMETLNQSRLHLLMKILLSTGAIVTPPIINKQEPLLREPPRIFRVSYGASLSQVLTNSQEYSKAFSQYNKGQKFIIHMSHVNKQINIAFNEKCEVLDQLQAGMIAEVVEYICGNYGNSPYLSKYDKTIQHALNSDKDMTIISVAEDIVADQFSSLITQVQTSGWITSHHLLGIQEWRYSWE